MFIAMFSFSQTFAKSLQVGGVTVTTDNADDVLGDGNVSYDAKTNTLSFKTINIMGSKSSLICTSDKSSDISVDEKTTSLTLSCKGTITYEGTATGVAGVQYGGRLIVAGSGVLKMTTDSSAILCEHLMVQDGSAVELCRDKIGYGYTLEADSITVDNSALYVHKGAHAYGVISTTKYFVRNKCYSNAKLLHKSIETRVSERYKYNFNTISNTYDYRYRTVSKWKRYDGWYNSNNSQVSELEVYPECYSVWVDGVQVTRYNYLDILGDGLYAYDLVTKTLTTKTAGGDVQFEGYLKLTDGAMLQDEYISVNGNSSGSQNVTIEVPDFEPSHPDGGGNFALVLWGRDERGELIDCVIKDNSEIDFPCLASGKITFDKETYTLTLDNVRCVGEAGFYVLYHSLNVNLIGNNCFYSDNPDMSVESVDASKLEFSGSGALDCSFFNLGTCDSLIIKDGCAVTTNYVNSQGVVTVDHSTLNINGDTLFDYYSGIDAYELNLVGVGMSNDSVLFVPNVIPYKTMNGIAYSAGGKLKNLDGVTYKGMLTISPEYDSYVHSVKVDEQFFDPTAPKYDLFGRPVRDNYKGVYIQSGRKFKSLEE